MGIKGKTTFELTDVNTGEVEIIEDNNMVTNALQDFLLTYGIFNNNPLSVDSIRDSALYANLLGGLFLFDNHIDEDVNNTFMPAGVKMIGNGSRGVSNSGVVTELGSYNSTESGVQNDGSIKFVYDYSTTQANGTISCACLTSLTGGYMGMGSEKNYVDGNKIDAHQKYTYGAYFKLAGAGDDIYHMLYPVYSENAIYCTNPYNITYASATASQHWSVTKKIEILKLRADFTSIGIRDSKNLNKVIDRFEVDIPQDILDYMGASTGFITPASDSFNGNIYVIFNRQSSGMSILGKGSYYWIMKIDKDRNVSSYKFTNNTSEALRLGSASTYDIITFNGDYLWVRGYDNNYIYGIKYSDSTQIIETGLNKGSSIKIYSIAENLIGISSAYYNSSYNYQAYSIYDVVNRTHRLVNGSEHNSNDYKYVPFADKKGVYLRVYKTDGEMVLIKDVRYLATINNLAEPVIKTSSKTMKVTYTITEV